mmetsp:Transcript_30893/g.102889  ORF Transcript_30893/g.102889 Transcript_30893/m.102889 type:complete len:245 (+) Transcript_30893:994-1728(+)
MIAITGRAEISDEAMVMKASLTVFTQKSPSWQLGLPSALTLILVCSKNSAETAIVPNREQARPKIWNTHHTDTLSCVIWITGWTILKASHMCEHRNRHAPSEHSWACKVTLSQYDSFRPETPASLDSILRTPREILPDTREGLLAFEVFSIIAPTPAPKSSCLGGLPSSLAASGPASFMLLMIGKSSVKMPCDAAERRWMKLINATVARPPKMDCIIVSSMAVSKPTVNLCSSHMSKAVKYDLW